MSVCLNLIRLIVIACFAYDKAVMNQRKIEKLALRFSHRKFQCEY